MTRSKIEARKKLNNHITLYTKLTNKLVRGNKKRNSFLLGM